MPNQNAPKETEPSPAIPPTPAAAAEVNPALGEAERAAVEAWQSSKLLDSCLGAEADKRKKMEVVDIIHFHRLALKEHRDAPERKRLASQATMRRLRRIFPHLSEQKLQPLLNATVEQLTPSGIQPGAKTIRPDAPKS